MLEFFCVMGVHFKPVKKILEELNIKVFIKTDNDIFKVPRKKEKRYAGYERVRDCLCGSSKTELQEILRSKQTEDLFRFPESQKGCELINNNMEDINEIFEKNGIYISNHHNGKSKFRYKWRRWFYNPLAKDLDNGG